MATTWFVTGASRGVGAGRMRSAAGEAFAELGRVDVVAAMIDAGPADPPRRPVAG